MALNYDYTQLMTGFSQRLGSFWVHMKFDADEIRKGAFTGSLTGIPTATDFKIGKLKGGTVIRDSYYRITKASTSAVTYNLGVTEAGMERYHEVVKDVTRLFGKKYAEKNILLKRACTEYEMVKGPSAFWFNTLEEDRTLDIIDAYVCVPRNNVDQPEMIKNHIRLRQALWAHANGDMSYVPYNGGHKFFPGYMTYHDKNIDDIKHDIALAVGMQHGINPETGAAFVAMAEDFKNANNVDKIGDLAHLLGMQQNNPINMLQGATTMTQEVPSELKTEIT